MRDSPGSLTSPSRWALAIALAMMSSWPIGCGSDSTPEVRRGEEAGQNSTPRTAPTAPTAEPPTRLSGPISGNASSPELTPNLPSDATATAGAVQAPVRHSAPVAPEIDLDRVTAMGIRKIEGRHLTLFTDLPSLPAVDELPAVFDQAVPQWCEYFGVEYSKLNNWRLRGSLIQQAEPFRQAGLLPGDLPPFGHGFNRGLEFWTFEQPSDYYRRHLMLHEGTHGFMQTQLGGAGPPWYMEGTAELMATHRWQDGKLLLRHFPRSKQETPQWGRITLVREAVAARKPMSLLEILNFSSQAHLQVEPYAWCWSASVFFDAHPGCRDVFRELRRHAADGSPDFSKQFRDQLRSPWPEIAEDWQVFLENLEYGYDLPRNTIVRQKSRPLKSAGDTVKIVADRGWQSTGLELQAGVPYEFKASGRYQLASEPQIWWCEPNGVTIRYHRGKPLGLLMAGISNLDQSDSSPLVRPEAIGLGRTLRLERGGTLFLRINDSPAELSDNAGDVTVDIRPLP